MNRIWFKTHSITMSWATHIHTLSYLCIDIERVRRRTVLEERQPHQLLQLVCLFVICDSWISWSKLFYCFGLRALPRFVLQRRYFPVWCVCRLGSRSFYHYIICYKKCFFSSWNDSFLFYNNLCTNILIWREKMNKTKSKFQSQNDDLDSLTLRCVVQNKYNIINYNL